MRYLVNNTMRKNAEGKRTFGYLGQCTPNTIIDIRDLMQIRHGNLDRTSYWTVYNNIVNSVMAAVTAKPAFYFKHFVNFQDSGVYDGDTLQLDHGLYIDSYYRADCVSEGGVVDRQRGIIIMRSQDLKASFFKSEYVYEIKDEYVIVEGDGKTLELVLKFMLNDRKSFAFIPLPFMLGIDAEENSIVRHFGAYYSTRYCIAATILNAYLGFMMNDLGYVCIGDVSVELVGQPCDFDTIMKRRDHTSFVHTHALEYVLMENSLLSFSVVRYTSDDFGKESK